MGGRDWRHGAGMEPSYGRRGVWVGVALMDICPLCSLQCWTRPRCAVCSGV